MVVKLFEAAEAAVGQFYSAWREKAPSPIQEAISSFQEAYKKPLTSAIYIAGSAMAPGLNREALKDPSAVEKLVLRHLIPSRSSLWVGDVVAFTSPLTRPGAEDPNLNIMVRRIAALEGMSMVSEPSSSTKTVLASDPPTEMEAFEIPDGHCWVLADNPDLRPPHVIDSRSFGFIPLSSIVGRVAYSITSKEEVINSPTASVMDAAVIEQEVIIDKRYDEGEDEGEGEGGGGGGKEEPKQ